MVDTPSVRGDSGSGSAPVVAAGPDAVYERVAVVCVDGAWMREQRERREPDEAVPGPTRAPSPARADGVLDRLLGGGRLERDVVGLVTAAGGGLSVADLAELTEAGVAAVERVVSAAEGVLTRRAGRWAGERQVVVFTHDWLRAGARQRLGDDRLAAYRERLCAWARTYQAGGGRGPWPADTPEFLLAGYPRMLAEAGDVDRVVELALDDARRDRLCDTPGGYELAVAELRQCQKLLLRPGSEETDLRSLALLSYHHFHLVSRGQTPTSLPGLWILLGRRHVAEARVGRITHLWARAEALAGMAEAAAAVGDVEHARRLAADAERAACAVTEPHLRGAASAHAAEAFAVAGDTESAHRLAADAETFARRISRPIRQAQVLATVARTTAAAGDAARVHDLVTEAERIARRDLPYQRALVLAEVTEAVAAVGDERARRLATEVEQIARGLARSDPEGTMLAVASLAFAAVGEPERAERLADAVPARQGPGLAHVARVLAAGGEFARAERVARRSADPAWQVAGIAAVARAAATAGDLERARRLAAEAVRIDRRFTDVRWLDPMLATVARAFTEAGDLARAEQTARSVIDPLSRTKALLSVAEGVARAAAEGAVPGASERAWRLTVDAERAARGIDEWDSRARMLIRVAEALARRGDLERAERVARDDLPSRLPQALSAVAMAVATDRPEDARRLATDAARKVRGGEPLGLLACGELRAVARVLVATGDEAGARRLLVDTEQAVRDRDQSWLTDVVDAAAAAGMCEYADRVARSITDPDRQMYRFNALVTAAGAAAAAGDGERARRLLADAERIARRPDEHHPGPLVATAEAWAAAGEPGHADRVAHGITDPDRQVEALLRIAEAAAAAGDGGEAVWRWFSTSELIARRFAGAAERESFMDKLLHALVRAGRYRAAERFAERAGLSTRRWFRLLGEMMVAEYWIAGDALAMLVLLSPEQAVRIVDALLAVTSREKPAVP